MINPKAQIPNPKPRSLNPKALTHGLKVYALRSAKERSIRTLLA